MRFIAASFIVAAFLVSLGFASHKQATMPCTGIVVNIYETHNSVFVDENDILQMVQNKFGTLEGKPISSINISLLEKIINTNPFISDAEVFSTVDGKVVIDVKQRRPLLRVINFKNESFYVDDEGAYMPPSEKYTARVPVASGYIYEGEINKSIVVEMPVTESDTMKRPVMTQLFNIAKFATANEFWNAEMQQLYVDINGDIEMIPRIGGHSVILGDDNNLEEKFKKLLTFYREGLNRRSWDKYKTINLKYKNQVVCTKK